MRPLLKLHNYFPLVILSTSVADASGNPVSDEEMGYFCADENFGGSLLANCDPGVTRQAQLKSEVQSKSTPR